MPTTERTTETPPPATVGVIGGTGTIGRRVVEQLAAHDRGPTVQPLSRRSTGTTPAPGPSALEGPTAVAALAAPDDAHAGRTYELTGPRLLSFAGVPAEEAVPLAELFGRVLDGRDASTTDVVAQVLGRPAGDFAAHARRTAATGMWDPSPAAGARP